jgi:hypothetical protein
LKGLGDDAKLAQPAHHGHRRRVVMPPLQAMIMDMDAFNLGFRPCQHAGVVCAAADLLRGHRHLGFRTSKVHGHTY